MCKKFLGVSKCTNDVNVLTEQGRILKVNIQMQTLKCFQQFPFIDNEWYLHKISRGEWTNIWQPSLGKPIKKIKKFFVAINFFILLRIFYFMGKPRAAKPRAAI